MTKLSVVKDEYYSPVYTTQNIDCIMFIESLLCRLPISKKPTSFKLILVHCNYGIISQSSVAQSTNIELRFSKIKVLMKPKNFFCLMICKTNIEVANLIGLQLCYIEMLQKCGAINFLLTGMYVYLFQFAIIGANLCNHSICVKLLHLQ